MRSTQTRSNPFTMMMNPEAIIQAVERSERLNRLQRRVCRPLDKPLIPKIVIDDQAAFDQSVELDESDAFDADDLS